MSIKRASHKRPKVSLIVPVYNETVRLVDGISQMLSFLKKQRFTWELILVDDGSEIPVANILADYRKRKLPIFIIRLPKNQGKGAAIGQGVAKARGLAIVFCDVDLSVPITQLPVFVKELERKPVVIASRRLPSSRILVHQSRWRESAGRIFTWVSNIICGTRVSDSTCGFKAFTRVTAQALFGLRRIDRWVFDAEILFLARKYGVKVSEIPVAWTNKSGSKVRLGDGMQSFVDLIRIRWYDIRGLYEVRPL